MEILLGIFVIPERVSSAFQQLPTASHPNQFNLLGTSSVLLNILTNDALQLKTGSARQIPHPEGQQPRIESILLENEGRLLPILGRGCHW